MTKKGETKAPKGEAKPTKALDVMRAAVDQKLGKGVAYRLEGREAASQVHEVIPSGIDVIDLYAVGVGGFPVGRMVEIFGDEACGKTSLLYQTIANHQRAGGVAVLADSEFSYDEDRATTLGIDSDQLLMLNARTLEDTLEGIKAILTAHDPKNGPLLIAWDSIASTKTKAGISASVGDKTPGEVARIFSDELPKIVPLMHQKRAALVALNQTRVKFGVMFGNNVETPGGKAIKFYASVRLQFFGGKAIKNALGEHTGKIVTIMGAKNRFAPPFRKVRVRFDYATGYNNEWSTIEHAKRLKVAKGPTKTGKAGRKQYEDAMAKLGWKLRTPSEGGPVDAGGEEE